MAPDRPTFLTLLDHEPVVAALTAIVFPSTPSLELDVPKNWIRRPQRIRAGHALAMTCRRSYETFARVIYRSIRVHTWTSQRPVVRGMLPVSRHSVRCVRPVRFPRSPGQPARAALRTGTEVQNTQRRAQLHQERSAAFQLFPLHAPTP